MCLFSFIADMNFGSVLTFSANYYDKSRNTFDQHDSLFFNLMLHINNVRYKLLVIKSN